MRTVEIFSRERAIFYTFPLQEIFSQIFFFFKKLSKHFFLFKAILAYKTFFKHLYLQNSCYLNQNSCYSSTSAPRCVKNLTYACYLINLCQTPSLFTVLTKLSTHSYPQTYYLSYFVPSSFQILIIFLIRP